MKQVASKNHFYPFTLRLATLSNVIFCRDKFYVYPVPPEDALSIENLFIHLKFTFDASVASGSRIVEWIGIGSEFPTFITDEPDYFRKIDLNVAADANRKVDIKLDLTTILNKDNVRYREYFETPVTTDYTYVIIKLSENLRDTSLVGTAQLCKLDALYTTKGIH